jgi:sulfite exporter TauE/SafE
MPAHDLAETLEATSASFTLFVVANVLLLAAGLVVVSRRKAVLAARYRERVERQVAGHRRNTPAAPA